MDHEPSQQPNTQKLHLLSFLFPITIQKEVKYALCFLLFLLSSFVIFNLVTPIDSQFIFGIGFFSQILPNNKKTSLGGCDFSNGRWVWDESYSLESYTENCQFLDPGFRCNRNGRKDGDYRKWRWQPKSCDLPRFNASDLLERSRNGRIVFAGDSIGRNQWESLLCMLAQAVSNQSRIYEVYGSPITKHKGFLSMRFHDYNLTVEYYRAPFLVFLGRPPENSSNKIRKTIRVDELHGYSKKWIGANVFVFNAGHWWNEEKTVKMGLHFQEGGKVNMTMDTMEAFRRSLQTWKSWALQNLDSNRSHIFFRSYSPVHYRNGTWDKGGRCDTDTEPETNHTKLEDEPLNNEFISNVIKQTDYGNRSIQFLNITYLTGFRFDGHPSKYREPGTPTPSPQDCSHWCLPGVPDTWNELLYAYLLSKGFRTK
ncbi:protein trichome birefringence-like 8 [Castanea sativa]|uniref:protein trichome birefringence-like 8 n=1 Tax=Castanea sativa TaxID=21020 RepID=UPI003F652F95